MQWMTLVLLVLAAFRLTHLIVFDAITEPLRRPFLQMKFLGDLLGCYWCAGIWVALLLVALTHWWPGPMRIVLLVLAVAGGQSLLESIAQRK